MKMLKKYKFSDKNHSLGGAISTVMGLASLGFLVAAVVKSITQMGEAGTEVGSYGFCSALLAVAGCIIGLVSFKEEEKYYLLSKIGSMMCGILSVLLLAIFLMGIGI